MKKTKKIMVVLLSLIMVFALAGCSGDQGGAGGDNGGGAVETKTLKIHSAWAENNVMNKHMSDFIGKVEEKSNGSLKIEWGGGPEAIPAFQLAEAIKSGMVDIAWTAHTYNISHIPVVEGVKLSTYTATELRDSGGFEFIDELYNENLNSHLLGNPLDGLTYNLYINKKIEKLEDFKGATIRATPAYQAFVEGLGGAVVNTPPGEVYQALERNVVQGYGWPSVGIIDFGWHEVTDYVIDPAFYSTDAAVLVSDKVWQDLTEEQRNVLLESMKEVEQEARAYYENKIAEERTTIEDAGVETITLTGEVGEAYLDLAYAKGWENVLEKAPEKGKKLRELVTK